MSALAAGLLRVVPLAMVALGAWMALGMRAAGVVLIVAGVLGLAGRWVVEGQCARD